MINKIKLELESIINGLGIEGVVTLTWANVTQESLCDITSTCALSIWKKVLDAGINVNNNWNGPMDLANFIVLKLQVNSGLSEWIKNITIETPGYINIKLRNEYWGQLLKGWQENPNGLINQIAQGKKIMVEFGHPNTHKEMHIGHLRTLITGESLARLGEMCGATVIRANYQGDIGPHVAKALYGVRKLLEERGIEIETISEMQLIDKAKFLGEAYVRGNQDYELNKDQIDILNKQLYEKNADIYPLYLTTRQWSLDYFESIYNRLNVKYDKFYFETEVANSGAEIVKDNIGTIFENDQDAIIFRGEKYGLHTRVFVTAQGTPTYEAKEMALALKQYSDFQFDLNLHIVANEQAEYFKVVFYALSQVDNNIATREQHISMGMVNLVGMKISSRTGIIVTINQLLEQISEAVRQLTSNSDTPNEDSVVELLAIGALKFTMLKQSTGMNIAFDINQSVSLLGYTGPYLQYTHARCSSILRKSVGSVDPQILITKDLDNEEKSLLFWINQFPIAVEKSWNQFSLHNICEYLHELAQRYNVLYNNLPILESDEKKHDLRVKLTNETAKRLEIGLNILGIEAPEKL